MGIALCNGFWPSLNTCGLKLHFERCRHEYFLFIVELHMTEEDLTQLEVLEREGEGLG